MLLLDVFRHLKKFRFTQLQNEKLLQSEMYDALKLPLEREYRLSDKDIIDFFYKEIGLGIEVKIKGTPRNIYRQLERYAAHDEIKVLFLVTCKTMGLPAFINDKPVYLISLGSAWL